MVVCKYFLQGTCRFGNNCKNEHTYNENAASVLLKKSEVDINVLVKAAAGDMLKAEKGSQWPLTCYGPFQAKASFPGFEDKCFEEIRLGFYEAEQNGTSDQYKQQLAQLLQEAQLKIKALQNPSPEAANMLKNIYYNTQNTFSNANDTAFGSKPTTYSNSIFGNVTQPNPQASNFAFAQPENKNIFGNTQSNFPTNNSLFGNTNYQNFSNVAPNKNVFGGTTSSPSMFQNVFSNPAIGQNVFAGATSLGNTGNQTIFGGGVTNPNAFGSASNQSILTSAVPSQDIFTSSAASQNVFTSSAPNQNLFSSATPNQAIFTSSANNQNVFGSTTPNQGVFTSAAPSQNVFTNSAPSQNIFASAPTSQNIFTNTPPNQNVFSNPAVGQNVFANATTNTSSIFGGTQQPQTFGNQAAFQSSLTQSSVTPANYTQSIFGSASASNPPNYGTVYSNQNSSPFSSPFVSNNTPTTTSNIFQQSNSNFSQTPVQNSVFNSQNTVQSHSASIFGNRVSQTTTVSMQRDDDPTIYSKLDELTSNDITQFKNKCFDFGKIPMRAPPLEMC